MKPLKILIWHVHGSYLYYLTQVPHTFYVPSKPDRSGDYVGRWGHIPWGDNVVDVPVEQVKDLEIDCIIFQRPDQYRKDQFEILSPQQRELPKIYIEHDPPWGDPTETRHIVDDPNMLLVHVTPFNRLMWDSGRTPNIFIDHGVLEKPGIEYRGELERGLVVVNHLARRGRRLGADIYDRVRKEILLDLIGMAAEESDGGLREVIHSQLPEFESHYRFFFNPIRYTSMGLAVIEAMLAGLPIIGLATTEMAMAIQNGISGYVDTNVDRLIEHMRHLLQHPAEARRLGEGARQYARQRFGIQRFIHDWERALFSITGREKTLISVGG